MTVYPRPGEKATLREWALWYVKELEWAVVPNWQPRDGACTCHKADHCSSPGKHPRPPRGVQAATTDEKKIRSWKWETANIGVATGASSGILVLDIDDGGPETLRKLEKRLGKLPPTSMQRTGSGKLHLVFRHPGGKVSSPANYAPGIDIRADGAQFIVEPSIHHSGGRYRWQVPPDEVPPAELPELAIVQARGAAKSS